MLSVTLTSHPVSTLTPAPAVPELNVMRWMLKLFSDFVEDLRREPLSSIVFYLMLAITMIPIAHFDANAGRVSLISLICFGLFFSIYVSFCFKRFDINRARLTIRGRFGYLVSALGFATPYFRLGFPEAFPGPVWLYIVIFMVLFLFAAPAVAARSSSCRSQS